MKQWAIGDWLVDGKSHYGDGLYERASVILDLEIRSLQEIKQITDKFEITERSVLVSFNHYKQVSSLKTLDKDKKGKLYRTTIHDMDKAQELLSKSEKEKLSVRNLREAWAKRGTMLEQNN